jgi:aminoglycoside phosphotransferase (APT) family kinase protein
LKRTAQPQDTEVKATVEEIVARLLPGERVIALKKEASAFATTARLWELQVTISDGTTLPMIFKESGRRARLPGAARALPISIYDPEREICVYQRVLARGELDTPLLYASVVLRQRDRYWLFLERVPGTQLRWAAQRSGWHRAASWLARAHAALQPVAERNNAKLLIHDARFYRRWLRRAQAFTGESSRNRRNRLAWLANHYDEVVDVLVGLPRTMIHGEFYPSNILIDESSSSGRISVIDWEMAALGPAVIDLAALTGGMRMADRKAIVGSYVGASPAGSSDPPEWVGPEALACARLQFAVQWLGWSRDWSPPEEQRHDWLAEAVELGETMGW